MVLGNKDDLIQLAGRRKKGGKDRNAIMSFEGDELQK